MPERTCIGCRKVLSIESESDLVRIVVEDGRAVVDVDRRRPGRGAWVHKAKSCVQNAARGGLAKSFRRAVDPSELLALTTLVIASEKS